MRPSECPACGEFIERINLKCNYCGALNKTLEQYKNWQIVELPNGNELARFNDEGMLAKFFPDGRTAFISDGGWMRVGFPDGRTVRINADGTTEIIKI